MAAADTYLLHSGRDHCPRIGVRRDIGNLRPGERKEQEGCCAYEFAYDSHGVTATCRRQTVQK